MYDSKDRSICPPYQTTMQFGKIFFRYSLLGNINKPLILYIYSELKKHSSLWVIYQN